MGTLIMSGNHSCRNPTYIYNVEKYYDTAKLMGRIYIQLFMIPSFSEQQNKKCCKEYLVYHLLQREQKLHML